MVAWDLDDPRHRDVLAVARSWGVSPTTFMGGPTIGTFTTPTGTTARLELAGWTDEDRAAAMGLADWEAELCPGCRQPLSETSVAEHEYQYEIGTAIRCHRCTAAAIAQEQHGDYHPEAVLFPITLKRKDVDGGDHGDGEVGGPNPAVEADAEAGGRESDAGPADEGAA